MKTPRIISVLAFLLVASSSCLASIVIWNVSPGRAAKEWGATIRTETVATNQVGVWLEFAPKGKLQTYSSVRLDITSDGRQLVSAALAPLTQTPDNVVIYFSIDPAYLSTSTLTVLYKISAGDPPYDGVCFHIGDWVKHGNHIEPQPGTADTDTSTDLTKQLAAVCFEIDRIKPGMTRAELTRLFKEDTGGLVWNESMPLQFRQHELFDYRHCDLIKVDVDFRPSDHKTECPADIITRISRPYLDNSPRF